MSKDSSVFTGLKHEIVSETTTTTTTTTIIIIIIIILNGQ